MSENQVIESFVDFEDEAAIIAMIDHAMAIEDAEEELLDHFANEV